MHQKTIIGGLIVHNSLRFIYLLLLNGYLSSHFCLANSRVVSQVIGVHQRVRDLSQSKFSDSEFERAFGQISNQIAQSYNLISAEFTRVIADLQWTWGGSNIRPRLADSLEKLIENVRLSSQWSPKDEDTTALSEFDSNLSFDSIVSEFPPASFPSLVKIQVQHGNVAAVADLVDLCAADIALNLATLDLLHIRQNRGNLPKLYYPDFKLLYSRREEAIERFNEFFSQFPTVPFGEVGDSHQSKLDLSKWASFLAVFPGPYQTRVQQALFVLELGWHRFENYKSLYPRPNNSEKLLEKAQAVIEQPGAHRCILLILGFLDDFEGPACRPVAFRDSLQEFVQYYRSQDGVDPIVLLLKVFTKFHKEGSKDSEQGWPDLEARLDGTMQNALSSTSYLESWPAVKRELLSNREALLSLFGKGPELYRFLKAILKKTDLAPLLGLGFDFDETQSLKISQFLLEELKRKGLDRLPSDISEVNYPQSRDVFLKNEANKSPLSVNVIKFVEDLVPNFGESNEGLQRPLFLHEVELIGVGDLAFRADPDVAEHLVAEQLIQRQIREPSNLMVEGLLQLTTENLLISNLAISDIAQNGSLGGSLKGMGAVDSGTVALDTASKFLKAPLDAKLFEASQEAFIDFLRGFGRAYGLFAFIPPDLPLELSQTKIDKWENLEPWQKELLNEVNSYHVSEETVLKIVLPVFHKERAKRMEHAAAAIRKLDSMLQNAKQGLSGKAQIANPPLNQILNQPEYITNEVKGAYGAEINLSLVRDFMPELKRIYLRFKSHGLTKGSPEDKKLDETKKRGNLTGPEIAELFAWTEKGPNAPYVWEALKEVVGADTIILFRKQNAILFEKIRLHAEEIEAIDFRSIFETKVQLLTMFPALLVNDRWKTYATGMKEYWDTIKAAQKNQLEQLNKIRAFENTKDKIEFLIQNPAIVSLTLQRHPKFARRIFELEKELRKWNAEYLLDKTSTNLTLGSEAILLAAAMVPEPTGYSKIGGLTLAGSIGLVVLGLDSINAHLKWMRSERALALDAAVAGMIDQSLARENAYELARLRERYLQAKLQAQIQGVVLGAVGVARLPATLKILSTQGLRAQRFTRLTRYRFFRKGFSHRLLADRDKAKSLLGLLPPRLAKGLAPFAHVRDWIGYVPRKLGLIRRTHGLYDIIHSQSPFRYKIREAAAMAMDVGLFAYPIRLFGYTWGGNRIVKTLGAAGALLALSETWQILNLADQAEAELVVSRVFQFSKHYRPILDWIEIEGVGPEQWLAIIQADDKFDKEYLAVLEERFRQIRTYQKAKQTDLAKAELAGIKAFKDRVEKLINESSGSVAEIMKLRWKSESIDARIEAFERVLDE